MKIEELKVLSILILALLPFSVAAQKGKNKKDNVEEVWYLDSTHIDISKTYLDPDNIEMPIIKKVRRKTREVYLQTKNRRSQVIALSNFKLHNSKLDTIPKMYIINGITIGDTTGVKLMPSAVKDLKIIKNAEDEVYRYHRTPVVVYKIETKVKNYSELLLLLEENQK